jgi:GH25 family lysozyme M1 (1,4-beta-N-acetylmuramidase)
VTEPTPPQDRPRRGVDLSYCQDPHRIDWDRLAELCTFVIVRFTYGTKPDRQALEHVRHARQVAMQIGGYHFFRPVESPEDQSHAFFDMAARAGLAPGDIVPGLDAEDDTGSGQAGLVCPSWQQPLQELAGTFHDRLGNALLYLTERDWQRLGSPRWALSYPLWVAHWGVARPRTPGGIEQAVWQSDVAPLAGVYPSALDQDVAFQPLPTIPPLWAMSPAEYMRLNGLLALTVATDNDDAARAERDAEIARMPDG